MKTMLSIILVGSSVVTVPLYAQNRTFLAQNDQQRISDQLQESQSWQRQWQKPAQASAGSLLGRDVFDPSGQPVGKVAHVHQQQPGPRVIYVVISTDGKTALVPWEKMSLQGDRLVINADRQKLQNAPQRQESSFTGEERWRRESYGYWGISDPLW